MNQPPPLQAIKKLPKEITQLVDKGNFIIAIQTWAKKQGLTLEQAKTDIDAYEAWRNAQQSQQPKNDFNQLTDHVTASLKSHGIKKMLPRWAKLLLVLVGIGLVGIIFFRYINR